MKSTLLQTTIFGSMIATSAAKDYKISNAFIEREFSDDKGVFKTDKIINKWAKSDLPLTSAAEFVLRVSPGTHTVGKDELLSSSDFKVVNVEQKDPLSIVATLKNEAKGLTVEVNYQLEKDKSYLRKWLVIKAEKEICVERVDVDAVSLEDASQPYQDKKITALAHGQWKPGLGQPVFSAKSGSYWGVEFPASYNFVDGQKLRCGYQYGRMLKPGSSYTTYKSVMGVSDDPKFVSDAFYDYINDIRVRPLRLQTQYNSWFDYKTSVNRENFAESVNKVNDELCAKRGVSPLKAYVIDDGWQNNRGNWSEKVWTVNQKFDNDFHASFDLTKKAKSHLGLWLSPGCNFGGRPAIPKMREAGMGALDRYMSLANTKYMDLLEERMVGLTKDGVTYFKLDGLFGHLKIRDFDIRGGKNGVPEMPQLGVEGLKTDAEALNDSKYDELKTYYLAVGAERMMKIFKQMGEVNPDVYIVISNGAWLSPWWLQHCDAVWMINAGDAAGGSSRTKELVYRDGVYHNIWMEEKTHYPMNSLFNHEPKKVKTGETKDVFRKYLYMNMSRGTGFVELYLKTFNLVEQDWDVLAESLIWVEDVFPLFERSRMHGGDPAKKEVYGYTAWNKERGFISLHNPGFEKREYKLTLDRAFGLMPNSGTFYLTSPIEGSTAGLEKSYKYGDTITVPLESEEIRILNFDPKPRKWETLKKLQNRTTESYKPETLEGHPTVGVWEYKIGKHVYQREITPEGLCILRHGDKVVWKRKVEKVLDSAVLLSGALEHKVVDGKLLIEKKFTATKVK